MLDHDKISSRLPNKRFGFVYFITVKTNDIIYGKLAYKTFKRIIDKYNAKYFGIRADDHIHAIVITKQPIDYNFVQKVIRPEGINIHFYFLNGKSKKDIDRISQYMLDKHEKYRLIGKPYIIKLAKSIILNRI